MKISHVKTVGKRVEELITQFISGEINENSFKEKYPIVLEQFQELIEDNVYNPLDLLVPTHDNSERSWKENMIAMYKNELKKLEDMLDDDEESYTEMLGTKERKSLCKNALKAITSQVQDITAREWINDNLVQDDCCFEFMNVKGKSKFGDIQVIYNSPIIKESFLLSALSNVLVKPSYSFQQILSSIREVSNQKQYFWAHCSEVDGVHASIKIQSFSSSTAFDQLEQLAWLEHTTGEEVQWGDCHLLLLPSDYKWMLKITNNFKDLKIEIHGEKDLLKNIKSILSRSQK